MADIEDLKNIPPEPPSGWKPGVEFDGLEGYITTHPTEQVNHEDVAKILRASRLNPDDFIVDWTSATRVTSHIGADGQLVQAWYKLGFHRKPDRTFDVEDLLDDIYDIEEPTRQPDTGWRTILITDQHIGKSAAAGGGTETIIQRWKMGVEKALKDKVYEGVNLVLGGDTIEGYVSQGGKNIVDCDLILSEQIRTAQHMVSWTIQRLLESAEQVIVSAVPGNHSETTRVQNMPLGDNFDVMILKNVEQAFDLNGTDRVRFIYPDATQGSVTYEAGDATYVVVHGHKFKSQMKGAQDWWAGHIANDREPSAATILLAGHFHNFQAQAWTSRRWIIFGPSLETESTWYSASTGATSRPGVLTFVTVDGEPKEMEIC